MKYRPANFTGEEIRALLDGRKTRMTVPVKPQPDDSTPGYWAWCPKKGVSVGRHIAPAFCPLGTPGDRIWCREKFLSFFGSGTPCNPSEASYVCFADGSQKFGSNGRLHPWALETPPNREGYRFSPSTQMPRWASRLTLEITSVSVLRVQEIRWVHVLAEGFKDPRRAVRRVDPVYGLVPQFRDAWNRRYGPDAWSRNPWCWGVEFKRVEYERD